MGVYAVVRSTDGLVVNMAVWDGETQWSPPAGTTAVEVTAGEGQIDGLYQDSAFQGPTPGVDSIDVVTGSTTGGTTVTVSGYNLHLPDVVVKFDGVAATNIQNQTKMSLQCDTPAHAAGSVDVTIENGEGSWTGRSTLSSGYEYTA